MVFYSKLYFYSSHIMSFAWSVMYELSLCLFCFVFLVMNPCCPHLIERSKIMPWLVRIDSMRHLNLFELWNGSSASLISFWAWCTLVFLEKCSHDSLRFILELVIFLRNPLLLHLNYFWEKNFFYAHVLHLDFFELSKATCETSPKGIDI